MTIGRKDSPHFFGCRVFPCRLREASSWWACLSLYRNQLWSSQTISGESVPGHHLRSENEAIHQSPPSPHTEQKRVEFIAPSNPESLGNLHKETKLHHHTCQASKCGAGKWAKDKRDAVTIKSTTENRHKRLKSSRTKEQYLCCYKMVTGVIETKQWRTMGTVVFLYLRILMLCI